MRRRALLAGLPVSISLVSGCLSGEIDDDESATETDTASDAPEFEVDADAPGEFILLRNQPQKPEGITVGDEFEIGVVLGNAGGESITGEATVELRPPNGDEDVQTATIVVEEDDGLPSGAARFFTTGLFEATVAVDILHTTEVVGFPTALGYCGLRRDLFLRCERTSFLVKQERRWLCQPAVTPISTIRGGTRRYFLSDVLSTVHVRVRHRAALITDV